MVDESDYVGTPWRYPDEESVDLYPGLVVHDGRVTGSITVGQSRLPLWAFIYEAIVNGWEAADDGYEIAERHDGYNAKDLANFLNDLLEMRGEFARLLLVLADAERCERNQSAIWPKAWWETKRHRKRVADQLRRCLAKLEGPPPTPASDYWEEDKSARTPGTRLYRPKPAT